MVSVKAGQKTKVPHITLLSSPVPDLIAARGILHNFTAFDSIQVDQFIETYQQYYGIPGVSLALKMEKWCTTKPTALQIL